MQERVILGIDPGTNIMGFGLIKICNTKISLLDLNVVLMDKLDNHALKLKEIFDTCTALMQKHLPDELAIEAPFYGKNVQSMLKLGRAQGVAIAAALNKSIPVFEYAPRKIKQAITGNGNASKEQVAYMLKNMFGLSEFPEYFDATDGLAVAVCHYYQSKSPQAGKSNSWKAFINNNPERIR